MPFYLDIKVSISNLQDKRTSEIIYKGFGFGLFLKDKYLSTQPTLANPFNASWAFLFYEQI